MRLLFLSGSSVFGVIGKNGISLRLVQMHSIRLGMIGLISLFLSHFMTYGVLPFQAGYQFPHFSFMFFFLCGSVICTANWLIHPWTFGKIDLELNNPNWSLLWNPLVKHWIFTLVAYSVTNIVVLVIYQMNFRLVGYLKYLVIVEVIITLEFLIVTLFKIFSDRTVLAKGELLVRSGFKMLKIPFDMISHFHSKAGVVTLYQENGERYITQFSSLEEVDKRLPAELFYRVNRQSLIHRQSIKRVIKDRNRKLLLDLVTPVGNGSGNNRLAISRYRSKKFKEWFEKG